MRCPSCSGAATILVEGRLLPSKLAVLRCRKCGMDFLESTAEDDYWASALQGEIYGGEGVCAERREFFGGVLKMVGRCGPGGGRLLDVGAGRGEFARLAAADGWEVSVVEPSRDATAGLAGAGIEVFNCAFEDFELTASFDCVTMLDLIEHVSDPLAALRKAAGCLVPGGVAVVLTPDGASALRCAARALGRVSRHLGGFLKYFYYPPHVSYLSARTLGRLAAASGLEVLETRRCATPKRFLAAKLRAHYAKYPGNGAFTALVCAAYPAARRVLANKLLFAARKASP